MTLRPHALLATLAAAAAWSLAPAALAQVPEESPPSPSAAQDPTTQDPTGQESATEQSSQPMPPSQQSQSAATPPGTTAPIEDKKIEQFADAYLAVHTIQQKASQDLQAASSPEEANKVKASAESEMIAAVERSGLQVPEFNHIVESMAADPNVRSRVAAELQERSGGAPPTPNDDGG